MNPFPGAYAHRGATTADLTPKMLKDIRDEIASQLGCDAANHYVQMVQDLPYLSAEAFLTILYTLEVSSWRWDRSLLLAHKEFSSKAATARGVPDGLLMRDETQYIKSEFTKLLCSTEEGVKLEKYSW